MRSRAEVSSGEAIDLFVYFEIIGIYLFWLWVENREWECVYIRVDGGGFGAVSREVRGSGIRTKDLKFNNLGWKILL